MHKEGRAVQSRARLSRRGSFKEKEPSGRRSSAKLCLHKLKEERDEKGRPGVDVAAGGGKSASVK
jgi:hypothetical protein